MGTNYSIRKNMCSHCQRAEEEVHLGKSSCGWIFHFQYNSGKYYQDIEEMREWTKDKDIFNEYGEKVSYTEFWNMVEEAQNKENEKYTKENGVDVYGEKYGFYIGKYLFTDNDFS